MGHPIVHWEIMGKDGKKLRDFYASLFDWNVQYDAQMNYGMVDLRGEGSVGGGIGQTENAPMVTFYVGVDDLQAYLNKAEGLGGKTVMPPTPIPNIGAFAMFSDPEGNIIGIFKE